VVIGVFANGFLLDHFGNKKSLLGSYILITAFIAIPFAAPTIEVSFETAQLISQVLFVGEVLCGIPWGVFNTMSESQ